MTKTKLFLFFSFFIIFALAGINNYGISTASEYELVQCVQADDCPEIECKTASCVDNACVYADIPECVPVLTTISISPAAASIDTGSTHAFTAVGLDQSGAALSVQPIFAWSSSDTTVATISQSGLATGLSAGGPVTITAASGTISSTASLTVVTPSSVQASPPATGGGGGSSAPTPDTEPTQETTIEEPDIESIREIIIEELKAKIVELLAIINNSKTKITQIRGISPVAGIPAGFRFTNILKEGQFSQEVEYLQIFLNTDPTTRVAVSGAGSPGLETYYFGNRTKTAVIKFQEKYASEILTPLGFVRGTGIVARMTIMKINALLGY